MKIIQLAVLLLACSFAEAQFPEYHVFLVSGNVKISKPGAKPVAIKQNGFVFKDQVITITEKSELTLSDKNRNFYVLKTPGVYKAKDLSKVNNYRVPGVTEKYLTLVWNELFNTHHDYSKFTKTNIAGVYGGVSRGSDCNNLLFPVADLKTAEDSLHFTWRSTSTNKEYTFSLYNQKGTEIINRIVSDTSLTLSLKQKLGLEPGSYYWKIKSLNGLCEDDVPVSFEIISRDNQKKAMDLIANGNEGDNVPSQLATIDKLEKAGMVPAARRYFQSVLASNTDDKALVKSYILFLLKYHYSQEAQTLWQRTFSN